MKTQSKVEETLSEYIDEEGTDWSLFTGLDIQHLTLYGTIRKQLSEEYPNPKENMEAEDDTVNIILAAKTLKLHCSYAL